MEQTITCLTFERSMSVSCNCEKCLVVIPFLAHLIIYKKYFINSKFETNEKIKEAWLMIK
jgi:hypothetical protein